MQVIVFERDRPAQIVEAEEWFTRVVLPSQLERHCARPCAEPPKPVPALKKAEIQRFAHRGHIFAFACDELPDTATIFRGIYQLNLKPVGAIPPELSSRYINPRGDIIYYPK